MEDCGRQSHRGYEVRNKGASDDERDVKGHVG